MKQTFSYAENCPHVLLTLLIGIDMYVFTSSLSLNSLLVYHKPVLNCGPVIANECSSASG